MCLDSQRERESAGKRDIIHSEGQNRIRDEARRGEIATRFLEVSLKCEGSSLFTHSRDFFYCLFVLQKSRSRAAWHILNLYCVMSVHLRTSSYQKCFIGSPILN